jgi:hypothetical protein
MAEAGRADGNRGSHVVLGVAQALADCPSLSLSLSAPSLPPHPPHALSSPASATSETGARPLSFSRGRGRVALNRLLA